MPHTKFYAPWTTLMPKDDNTRFDGTYQSKALFKGFDRPLYNFNLIYGTYQSKKEGPDCLDNYRCSSFFVHVVP